LLNIRLAIRFIFNQKESSYSSYASWLTIIGLSIGVAALMLTTSIIGGFREVVSDKLLKIKRIASLIFSKTISQLLILELEIK
jgi:ABC-type lipoprotein release transport system permease subunit